MKALAGLVLVALGVFAVVGVAMVSQGKIVSTGINLANNEPVLVMLLNDSIAVNYTYINESYYLATNPLGFINVTTNATYNTGYLYATNGTYLLKTGDTATGNYLISGLTINSSGNVGIGTTSPLALTHIFAGGSGQMTPDTGTVLLIENDDTAYINFLTPSNRWQGITFGDENNHDQFELLFNNNDDKFHISKDGAATDFLVINNVGNVGIGTTSPGIMLDVHGNITSNQMAGSGNAFACVDSTGMLYRSATACA